MAFNLYKYLGTNLIHRRKNTIPISEWVFENMTKFTKHSRAVFHRNFTGNMIYDTIQYNTTEEFYLPLL